MLLEHSVIIQLHELIRWKKFENAEEGSVLATAAAVVRQPYSPMELRLRLDRYGCHIVAAANNRGGCCRDTLNASA